MTINLELTGCAVSGVGVGTQGEVIEITLGSPSGDRYTLYPNTDGYIEVEKEDTR